VLFAILWFYSGTRPPVMAVSGMFLFCYGIFRFTVEFVRVPDAHLGYLAFDWLTMGQVLSVPMIILGALFIVLAYQRNEPSAVEQVSGKSAGKKNQVKTNQGKR